jgi:uncharacterized protein YdbL (DUF1318 family)
MRKPLMTTLKALIAALMLAIALPAASALADPLDDARAAGLVGERPDGYVDIVAANPTADIRKLVADINAQRRQVYEKLAAEKGVAIEQIGALAAEKTINERLQAGWYYMDSSGQWQQK